MIAICSVHDTTEKVWRHLNFFNTNATFISKIRKSNVINAEFDSLCRIGQDRKAGPPLCLKHSP